MTLIPRWSSAPWLFLVTMALIVSASVVLVVTPATAYAALWVRWGAIMVLAWWAPGALLVAHWRLPDLDLPTAAVFAVGLGLLWLAALLLLVHWWPGPLAQWQLVAVYACSAAVLSLGLLWRPLLALAPTSARTWAWVVGLLLLGAVLRLPGLDYHEFHTDEVVLLTRAREAMRGEDDALAQHTKGPAELAVATVVYRTLDTATEGTTRLPFALASVASIVAVALLGRALFSVPAGVWGGVLLAVNGFALGLSRIAQYQPAVMLLGVLAVFAVWEYVRSQRARWLALSVTLATWGLLFHYELALVLPAVGLAAWFGWRRSARKWEAAIAFLLAGVVGGIAAGIPYLRAFQNSYFGVTESYLGSRMGTIGQTFGLPFFFEISTFYNATWFVIGLLILLLAGVAIGVSRARRQTLILVVWFLPYLFLYLFVVQFPGTHFYTMMPSWSLLAALPLAVLSEERPQRVWLRYVAWGGLALWLGVSIYYLYLVFFRQDPEYVVNYASERNPFYWAPYGEDIPEKPRFGLPIYEGWKTLGVLNEWHYLTGTYASNEYSRHLRWYLGGLDRVSFEEQPDYIFVAEHLQEPDPAFGDEVLNGYQQIGEVQVRGEPRIAIWSKAPLPGGYASYRTEWFDDAFTGLVAALDPWPEPAPQVRDVVVGEGLTLVSAGVDRTEAFAGDRLHVLLEWMPDRDLGHDYKLFVHLAGANRQPVAQWDAMPGLNTAATSRWRGGAAFTDHVLLQIPDDTPPGAYTLLAGLYDPATGARVGDRGVEIADVAVR